MQNEEVLNVFVITRGSQISVSYTKCN